MAWIVVDLDNTLLSEQQDPMTGESAGEAPMEGAVEACQQFAGQGHRVTVYTSRFAPMPESEKQRLREQIEQDLAGFGFPMEAMEVWTGTTKPAADIFIGSNHVTLDGDWNLALAQTQMMLSERGLAPEQQMPMEGQEQYGQEEVQQPEGEVGGDPLAGGDPEEVPGPEQNVRR